MSADASSNGNQTAFNVNLEDYSESQIKQAFAFVSNNAGGQITSRADLARYMGRHFEGRRDLTQVLGYPARLTVEHYNAYYERGDIAERIVAKPARDTWQKKPYITDDVDADETEFTRQLELLVKQSKMYHYCRRADVLAGIGEYGLLFIGVADGETDLSQPVGVDKLDGPDDLAYLTPFGQLQVQDWVLGKDAGFDETHEMYSRPVMYQVDISDPQDSGSDIRPIHYSRVIHIAEGTLESDIRGTPRLRPVFNRLMDYEKVVGASAEMFWTGADRKFHFNVEDAYSDLSPQQLEELDADVQALVHEMQNYIKTAGVDMEVIGGEDPDPTGVFDAIMSSIAGAIGMPKRILQGSERGELASTQDRANWFAHVDERRENFAEPMVLRPLIDRLRRIGILPEPIGGDYEVQWPTLFELTEKEVAEIHRKRAEILRMLSPGDDPQLLLSKPQLFEYISDGTFPDPEEMGMGPDDGLDEIPTEAPEPENSPYENHPPSDIGIDVTPTMHPSISNGDGSSSGGVDVQTRSVKQSISGKRAFEEPDYELVREQLEKQANSETEASESDGETDSA